MNRIGQWNSQHGFGAILAIIVLVIMAGLAATLVSVSTTQQLTSAEDAQSAKALEVARTGTDIGLFNALSSHGSHSCSTQTVDLTATTGFRVTITCNALSYNEGNSAPGVPIPITIYQITAVACNSTTICPPVVSMANSPGYIERQRQVSATN